MSEVRFRMDPKHGRTAWTCTPAFAIWGMINVWWSLTDPSFKRPLFCAWLFGSFWGAWTLLGIYLLLAYYRYALAFTDTQVKKIGAFTNCSVPLDELLSVQWKTSPVNGCAVLKAVGKTMKIRFGNLNKADRQNAIQTLRNRIPDTIQHGWSSFTSSPYTDYVST